MAKAINLVGSNIKSVWVERNIDDSVTITVVGSSLDGDGNPIPAVNLVMDWMDLPVNIRNVGNTFLKHLSRDFNNFVAAEDSETWEEPS